MPLIRTHGLREREERDPGATLDRLPLSHRRAVLANIINTKGPCWLAPGALGKSGGCAEVEEEARHAMALL